MARYIDAEALTDHMLEHYNDLCEKHGDYDHYTTGYGDAIDAIENAPTADVVPKSEVEELQTEIEELQAKVARLRKENIELLVSKGTDIHISMEKLLKVRTEHPIFKAIEEKVAREIFEELARKSTYVFPTMLYTIAKRDVDELKKKYTEEQI